MTQCELFRWNDGPNKKIAKLHFSMEIQAIHIGLVLSQDKHFCVFSGALRINFTVFSLISILRSSRTCFYHHQAYLNTSRRHFGIFVLPEQTMVSSFQLTVSQTCFRTIYKQEISRASHSRGRHLFQKLPTSKIEFQLIIRLECAIQTLWI